MSLLTPTASPVSAAPEPPPPPALPPIDVGRNRRALIIGIVVFAVMSLWMGTVSKGFLEADSCTHYTIARHALEEPANLVSVWGRPLCTLSYVFPAVLWGVMGVRVTSLSMAIVSALVTYRIARVQGYRLPALAAILLLAQPLFYMHSFSELTEIPFALVAVLAFWAYQSRQFLAMTLLVAITPSGRPEGFFLIALAAVALMAHRRWYYLVLLPVPLMIWSYCGWLTFNSPPDLPWYLWLKRQWPYAAESAYGSGPWHHFIKLLPVLVSPFVFPVLLPGIWLSIRAGLTRRNVFRDHAARCQFLIALIPLTITVVHAYLWFFGKMASNGELRYLLCVAPLWALLCGRGWEWAWERFKLPAPFLFAALAATGPVYANWYYRVVPLRLYNEDFMCQAAANFYRDTPGLLADYPRVMASGTRVYFMLDRSPSNKAVSAEWGWENVKKVPPGVILIWDKNALTNSDTNLIIPKADVEAAGWIYIGHITYNDETCHLYLSTKTAGGAPTDLKKYGLRPPPPPATKPAP
jgi:hypothetical protein